MELEARRAGIVVFVAYWAFSEFGASWDQEVQVNGIMVCGEVVDVLWDDRAGFNPLELVYAYETVVYDSGGSALFSLACVGGRQRGGAGMAARFESPVEDYVANVIDHS